MANLIFNGIVALLEKAALAANFYPDSVRFAKAYALGEKKAPKFSQETFEQCHEALLEELKFAMDFRGKWRHLCPTVNGPWHTSAAGVVGKYESRMEEISSEGIRFRCWDTWDFNPGTGYIISIPIPAGSIPIARQLAKLFPDAMCIRIESEKTAFLDCSEDSLSSLNEEHSFKTEWTDFVSWEELNSNPSKWRWGREGTTVCYKK